jgi:protease I
MATKLADKKVAVLATNGFEESEFTEPIKALKEAGAQVDVVSLQKGKIKAWAGKDWGNEYDVNKIVSEVNAQNYDALVFRVVY